MPSFHLGLGSRGPRILNQRSLLENRNAPLVGRKQQFHKALQRHQQYKGLKISNYRRENSLDIPGTPALYGRETGSSRCWGKMMRGAVEGVEGGEAGVRTYSMREKEGGDGVGKPPLNFSAVWPSQIKIEAEWSPTAKVCQTWTKKFMEGFVLFFKVPHHLSC